MLQARTDAIPTAHHGVNDGFSSLHHDNPAYISGWAAQLDAAIHTLTGFIMGTLSNILRSILLYDLPDAKVLSWDAIEQCVRRGLQNPASYCSSGPYFGLFVGFRTFG